ncbi:hypothetical protein VTN31DRAFT_7379 [Thermomyces dupontii]|uniref:uncharacterized protein n=1 Tax=Talaromyces thermophilus TaxID=28565 RepID=UPI0037430AD3
MINFFGSTRKLEKEYRTTLLEPGEEQAFFPSTLTKYWIITWQRCLHSPTRRPMRPSRVPRISPPDVMAMMKAGYEDRLETANADKLALQILNQDLVARQTHKRKKTQKHFGEARKLTAKEA